MTAEQLGLYSEEEKTTCLTDATKEEYIAEMYSNGLFTSPRLNNLSWSDMPSILGVDYIDTPSFIFDNIPTDAKFDWASYHPANVCEYRTYFFIENKKNESIYIQYRHKIGGQQTYILFRYINRYVTTTTGEEKLSISTQYLAQKAINKIQNAIVNKDKIRANLVSTQNRLQNNITKHNKPLYSSRKYSSS